MGKTISQLPTTTLTNQEEQILDILFEIENPEKASGEKSEKLTLRKLLGGYASLVMSLVQDGTNTEPTVTELQNTVGGMLTSYISVGKYRFTTDGIFTEDKTHIQGFSTSASNMPWIPITSGSGGAIVGYYNLELIDENDLDLNVVNASFVATELGNIIGTTTVLFLPEIRVYE